MTVQRTVFFASYIAALVGSLSSRPEETICAQDFEVSDLLRGWESLERALTQSTGMIENRTFNTVAGIAEPEAHYVRENAFAMNGPLFRRAERDAGRIIEALNPRYQFEVSRVDNQTAFKMDAFRQKSEKYWDDEAISAANSKFSNGVALCVKSPWCLLGFYSLPRILKRPETEILKLESDPTDPALVRLQLKCLHDIQEWAPLDNITVRLDPGNHWAVLDCEVVDSKYRKTGRVEYAKEPLEGHHVRHPVYSERAIELLTPTEGTLETWTVKKFAFEAKPEEYFELAAFGLSEPPIVSKTTVPLEEQPAGKRQVSWLLIANLVLIGLIAAVFFARQRFFAPGNRG